MMTARVTALLILVAPLLMVRPDVAVSGWRDAGQADTAERREAPYRQNNLGVALMEQYKHEEAAARFREALAGDPGFVIARVNLALALYFQNDGRGATTEALAALKQAPENAPALYVLGASYKKERLYTEALAVFERLLKIDGRDPYTNIQVGQIHSANQQYVVAADYFRRALEAEPYNSTAAYSLAQALIRSGKAAEGQQMLAQFQKLKASGYATTLGLTYGEQGRYAEGVVTTGIETGLSGSGQNLTFERLGGEAEAGRPDLRGTGSEGIAARRIARVEMTDDLKRRLITPFSRGLSICDLDGDRQPDLVVNGIDETGRPFIRLLRNSGGRLSEVMGKSVPATDRPVAGTVAGDFDNDGRSDLVVF
ncbi:MAG: hypothetical protein EBZ36_14855, partial [Acidobacteria bacterium]|nr:hypothetical protein [Acidobacteriota bacterium]